MCGVCHTVSMCVCVWVCVCGQRAGWNIMQSRSPCHCPCLRYLRIFLLPDQPVTSKVQDASFCILFLAFWKRDIDHRQKENSKLRGATTSTLGCNFITSQTCTDVLITCNMVINCCTLFRTNFPQVRVDFSRMSSRFSEYLFQVRNCQM